MKRFYSAHLNTQDSHVVHVRESQAGLEAAGIGKRKCDEGPEERAEQRPLPRRELESGRLHRITHRQRHASREVMVQTGVSRT